MVGGLFVFVGAEPNTEWLNEQLALDDHGFILTGQDIPLANLEVVGTAPLILETSRAGIFAVGDVRSGSIKRVATAIGEGSMAITASGSPRSLLRLYRWRTCHRGGG